MIWDSLQINFKIKPVVILKTPEIMYLCLQKLF